MKEDRDTSSAESAAIEAHLDSLTADIADRAALGNLFHYCQFLLDDDAMVTKNGNLTAEGRALLHRRMAEVFGFADETGESTSDSSYPTDS